MTYTGWNPDVLLDGLTCEHCGYRIVEGQARLAPKQEDESVSFCTLVPVHEACMEVYRADRDKGR